MAVTGWVFALFVAVHMVGNLKAYAGADDYNAYALWLRTAFAPLLPYEGLLWILRVVLLVSLVLHVGAGLLLWVRGRRHRGPHRRRAHRLTAVGARSMLLTVSMAAILARTPCSCGGGPGTVRLSPAEFGVLREMIRSGGLIGNARRMLDGLLSAGNPGVSASSAGRLLELFEP